MHLATYQTRRIYSQTTTGSDGTAGLVNVELSKHITITFTPSHFLLLNEAYKLSSRSTYSNFASMLGAL